MKYKINGFLYYDATDATLSINDEGTSDTQLSITANALLYFLLQQPGVITRDEIMEKVWDDNGLTSSNGNLNQYLSLLRKSFRHYQIDNFIITVSRGRLEINKDITVEVVDDNHMHPLFICEEEERVTPEEPAEKPNKTTYSEQTDAQEQRWMIGSAILFVAALALLWTAIISERSINIVQLNPVSAEICELFSNEKIINAEMGESYLNSFNAVREKLGISCNKERRFVFYYSDKFQNKGLGRTFMAQCAKNENNPYAYCDNYFYYSWK
ncbi:transcriptional regulatory protein C terminal domain [Photobacterium aphoticum]|uniref:Transcriptional regulatory protein C terminal domain n=1 Tax=Photobacterium aphoticum TaxID=754436 RepID=A0A090QQZ5_9GAMM|nr:transcriptional regulatory protein C terminal domain [Photobacterium aphoticum]